MSIINLIPNDHVAHARVPLTSPAVASMEGRKQRLKDGSLSFTASPHNIGLLERFHPDLPIERPQGLRIDPTRPDIPIGNFATKKDLPLFRHQKEAFDKAHNKECFGIFHEPGLGKSRTAIDLMGSYFAQGKITGVLIVTFKGLDRQWVNQQIPTHMGTINNRPIRYEAQVMPETKPPVFRRGWDLTLEILTCNFEALNSKFRSSQIYQWCMHHKGALMVIVDESHAIKNLSSSRTENCIALSRIARFRLIMTGTPIAKQMEDEYVQSKFLDDAIFGYEYLKSFQTVYRNRDGTARNVDQFKQIMAPYIHRMRKEDAVDMPPKIYEKFEYDISPKAKKAYRELRRNFFTTVDEENFTVQNGAVLMLRLQQICCGVLVNEDKSRLELGTERLDALAQLLPKYEEQEKIIIWSRFRADIEPLKLLCEKYAGVATLHGEMSNDERLDAADKFMNNHHYKFGVFNASVGGTGFNFQGQCTTAIYYTNSFNSIERWQSEDRIHRIGTKHPCNYVDIVARNTVDEYILKSLRDKKELSSMILDGVKMLKDFDDE